MNPFKKSTRVKNLLQMPFTTVIVLSIALLSGCGSSQGLVEMPDDPIPKPDKIEVFSADGAEIVE